jgi:hypothetical protein
MQEPIVIPCYRLLPLHTFTELVQHINEAVMTNNFISENLNGTVMEQSAMRKKT